MKKYLLKEVSKKEKEGFVINANGREIEYKTALHYMDAEIREQLHAELVPCSEQTFFTAYEKAHQEKFGEQWELSKSNPVW